MVRHSDTFVSDFVARQRRNAFGYFVVDGFAEAGWGVVVINIVLLIGLCPQPFNFLWTSGHNDHVLLILLFHR